MNYFLLIDSSFFETRLRPALAACWRSRSFVPSRDLCKDLLPRVQAFHERYHIGEGESLVEQAADNLVFDREFWYALVGELLFYVANEVPEFQTCPETLAVLVDPNQRAMLKQAHHGSRSLSFGAAVYRPHHCGLNDSTDVARISQFLTSLEPQHWQPDQLAGLPDLDEAERVEELAFACDCLSTLADTFRRAGEAGRLIVHESV